MLLYSILDKGFCVASQKRQFLRPNYSIIKDWENFNTGNEVTFLKIYPRKKKKRLVQL